MAGLSCVGLGVAATVRMRGVPAMNELPSRPDALPLDMRIAARQERSPQEKNHLASSSRDPLVHVLMLKLTIWLCYACWHKI